MTRRWIPAFAGMTEVWIPAFVPMTIFLCLFPVLTYATMPVIDYTAISKMTQEYQKLTELYKNAESQLEQEKQLVSDAEGHYGFGVFENSINDLKQRQWSPDTWDDTLQGLSGGNPERYQQLMDEYKKSHPVLSGSDYEKGATENQSKTYAQSIAVNRAATVNASYAFNDIKQHLQNVHDISSKIDQSTNTKAAVDLNSRLNAELAYISVQELKMLTLINQQLANQQSSEISESSDNSKFNTLPDA
ncbi:MAG: type IV secretion system protein [Pseudomonadota bacterium]